MNINSEIFLNSNLSTKQQQVIELYLQGKNVFVTGSAGSGKSYLLNYLKQNFTQNGLEITASTGISAVNIGASTVYSWAGIGLANQPVENIIDDLFSPKFSKIRKRIIRTSCLAIDEISMISVHVLDILDQVFKAVRNSQKSFGGMQILLFGDFLQLPPITSYGNKIEFCFNSQAWQNLNLHNIVLDKIYRQDNDKFIKLLNNLRLGIVDESDKKILTSRMNISDQNSLIRPTILTTHNSKVMTVNESFLKQIPHVEEVFTASYEGNEAKIEFLKKNCLANQILRLKINAQVMMIRNSFNKDGIINGSLGIVKDFSKKKYPIVEFANGKILTIAPESWVLEQIDSETRIKKIEASLTQIPLILAWAITIHKSQGLTLDKISCDLSQSFSPGQSYVALSRAKSLEGVFIESINFDKITANDEAVKFYKDIRGNE